MKFVVDGSLPVRRRRQIMSTGLLFLLQPIKGGDTIKRVYDSLINMELPAMEDGKSVKFEWLVVNDGSTDHTEELLKQWCEGRSFVHPLLLSGESRYTCGL